MKPFQPDQFTDLGAVYHGLAHGGYSYTVEGDVCSISSAAFRRLLDQGFHGTGEHRFVKSKALHCVWPVCDYRLKRNGIRLSLHFTGPSDNNIHLYSDP